MAREKTKPDPIVTVVEALRKRKGLVIVVSAPSGAGKTTVCEKLLAVMPELAMSVSFTTRRPRKGERDGRNYYFVSRKRFEDELNKGNFVEWAEVHGHYYGTPRSFLEKRVQTGKDTVLDIDVQGAYKISKVFPGAVLILLLPPSLNELESRLRGRRSDRPQDIRKRLLIASREFSCFPRFDYLVANEDIKKAVERLSAIVKAERCRVDRLNC